MKRLIVGLAVLVVVGVGQLKAEVVVIDFEDLAIPPGTHQEVDRATSRGFIFDVVGSPYRETLVNNDPDGFDSGSTFLQLVSNVTYGPAPAYTIEMREVPRGNYFFDLLSLDLGTHSDGESPLTHVRFRGMNADGSVKVERVVNTQSGFTLVTLDDEWKYLKWIEITPAPYETCSCLRRLALDNVTVETDAVIPEPSILTLLSIAALALLAYAGRRHHWR